MTEATESRRERRERGERTGRQIAAFLRSGPHEPMATRAEVLAVPCSFCGAAAGAECDTRESRVAFMAGMTFGREFAGVHMRRYLDKTGDPR